MVQTGSGAGSGSAALGIRLCAGRWAAGRGTGAPGPVVLALAAALGLAAGPAAAGDLGAVTGTVDGVAGEWRVPEGVLVTPDRAAAAWQRVDGSDYQIIVEAADPARSGHPGEGLVAAIIQAGPEGENIAVPYLVLVGDWPADALTPDFVYHGEGAVTLGAARLEPPQHAGDRLHLDVAVEARLCAQDIDGVPVDPPGAPRCVEVALRVATSAMPIDMVPDAPAANMRAAGNAAAPPAAASGGATLEVLGTLTATLDGTEREWLTLRGEIRGEEGATAHWRQTEIEIPGFAATMGSMLDQLPAEERARIEAQLGALDGMMRGEGQVAEALDGLSGTRGGVHRHLDLIIGGHDPESPNILTDGTLTLEVALPNDPVVPGTTLPVEVIYVVEGGSMIPRLFYVSGEDGSEARVTFDRLELEPGGGHAAGRFSATLCRMESARLMEGADLSDCIPAEGMFDTALGEDTGR